MSRSGITLYVKIYNMQGQKKFDSRYGPNGGPARSYRYSSKLHDAKSVIKVAINHQVKNEFLLVVSHIDGLGLTGASERACWFWLHTSFLSPGTLRLERKDIDRAAKDKKHKRFPPDFWMSISFSGFANHFENSNIGCVRQNKNSIPRRLDGNDTFGSAQVKVTAETVAHSEKGQMTRKSCFVSGESIIDPKRQLNIISNNGSVRIKSIDHRCVLPIPTIIKSHSIGLHRISYAYFLI